MLDKTSRKFMKIVTKDKPNAKDGRFTFEYAGAKLGLDKQKTFACIRFWKTRNKLNAFMLSILKIQVKRSCGDSTQAAKGIIMQNLLELNSGGRY